MARSDIDVFTRLGANVVLVAPAAFLPTSLEGWGVTTADSLDDVIGEVDGRHCVIMDDMVDTAGTLTKAAEVLKERGAKKVVAYCTHPVLSGPAIERIVNSPLDELVVTDTIPLTAEAKACSKIRQLSCAPLLAETFKRISQGHSVMSLFTEDEGGA